MCRAETDYDVLNPPKICNGSKDFCIKSGEKRGIVMKIGPHGKKEENIGHQTAYNNKYLISVRCIEVG